MSMHFRLSKGCRRGYYSNPSNWDSELLTKLIKFMEQGPETRRRAFVHTVPGNKELGR